MFSISSDDEHQWNSYLIETKSVAAASCKFRQSFISPTNQFRIGEKIESIDPRNRDSWCIATIIDKDGPRLRLRLDGTDDRNDFWRLVDSDEIRVYGTTVKTGGQIVPPLGFQQNSTRWARYFEKNIKNGPFADESCFKPSPEKPARNLFEIGEKLEAVDPRHPHIICPATVNAILSDNDRLVISLDGWSSSNNFQIDYSSRDIFPVGWSKSAGIRLAKVSPISPSVLSHRKRRKTISSMTKSTLIVTVFWNYVGDNSGVLLNPQRFDFQMPTVFGPNRWNLVLKTIFDSSINCSFQPSLFLNRIREIFSSNQQPSTQIKLEKNSTVLDIPLIDNEDEFWQIIQTFQNGILAGNDLFVSTQPNSINRSNKRKSIEFELENEDFIRNAKISKSIDYTKSSLTNIENETSCRLDCYTPNDVGMFIREIDSSFDDLACRFVQEEVDGQALVLLTTDTLMRHMGLKLGPSLKIIDHIEKLKNEFVSFLSN